VSTGPLSGTSGPSSPDARPQRWRPSRKQTPARTGILRHRVTQALSAHRSVVATSLNPASDAATGASRERTANASRSTLAHPGNSASTKGRAATFVRPGVQVPHSVSRHSPRRTARELEYAAPVDHPFWSGLDRSPVAPPGQLSRANRTPDDAYVPAGSSLRVINSLPLVLLMIYRNSATNLWCLRTRT